MYTVLNNAVNVSVKNEPRSTQVYWQEASKRGAAKEVRCVSGF
jgi:hypothetical protein